MGFQLSQRSLDRLLGVHPDLVRVVRAAAEASPMPFVVLEGLRTLARQVELVRVGASRTMKSRHLTGHAVDIAPLIDENGDGSLDVSWRWPHYDRLAPMIFAAADRCGVPIEWGGHWVGFRDGPHWQLPHNLYPAPPAIT